MPAADTWLAITAQIPFWAAILAAVLFLLAIAGGVRHYTRLSKRERRLRMELQEAQQQQRVGGGVSDKIQPETVESAYLQFIYNISHEVSNPLQSIQTNLDNLAKLTPAETTRMVQSQAIISAEIRRLRDLTENLRLLAHLETPDVPIKREPVNVKGVIEGVLMTMAETAESRGVRLVYNGPERPARVLGDRDQLHRVLLNLVDNGIKYSRQDGGEVVIAVQEQGQRMLVRVVDDGIGISPEDLPYIFDTAYQAPRTGSLRRAGSGLGLAIVKRIIERHGGQISTHSLQGSGTTMAFDLPLFTPN